jgi:hypothetical protein
MTNVTNIRGIITQDQKGGQNVVNNYGPPELHITADQRQKFLVVMPNGAGERIGIRLQDGSSAGRTFFKEVVALFANAGWLPIETDAAKTTTAS